VNYELERIREEALGVGMLYRPGIIEENHEKYVTTAGFVA